MKKVFKIIFISLLVIVNLSLIENKTVKSESLNVFDCNLDFSVAKNRQSKSLTKDFVVYKFTVKNLASNKTSFKIVTSNVADELKERSRTTKKTNVSKTIPLETIIINSKKQIIENISLNSGESISFKVKLIKTKDTGFEKWNYTKVSILSNECKGQSISKVLKTYIPNPNLR